MSMANFFRRLFSPSRTTLPPRTELIESIRQGLQDGSLHIQAVYGIVIDRNTRPSGYDDKRLLELYWSIRKGREPEEELIRIIKEADREFRNKLKAESRKNKRSKPKKSRPAIRLRKTRERQKKQTRRKSESSGFHRMAGEPSGDSIGFSRTDLLSGFTRRTWSSGYGNTLFLL